MSTSKNALLDPAKSAKAVQLRYVNADMQGMHRTRKGTGWSYTHNGKRVTDKDIIDRANALVLPALKD